MQKIVHCIVTLKQGITDDPYVVNIAYRRIFIKGIFNSFYVWLRFLKKQEL